MTQKHTPGPWDCALERGCHGVIARSLPEGGANFVAMVGNDADSPEKEPERFANARLIAAAPELLEALKDCVDRFVAEFPDAETYEPILKARAAIAKAEGGAE